MEDTARETVLHDVVVLSDLHLGRGKNPETGRYHGLEAFFYDDDLRSFCVWLRDEAARRRVPLKVVFNGDVFDVLRIEPEVAPVTAGWREKRFGLTPGPTEAARRVSQILAGHPAFVDGVALLLEAGIDVLFLPGNHDVELQWEPVQREVRRALLGRVRARAGEEAVDGADGRLAFAPWFYHEPGRLWLEHGCQYDGESCFRFLLRSALADSPQAARHAERDLPLGSFFQRYLYNAFGHVTFIVPSSRANLRYFKWLLTNQPALVARVVRSHGPFVLQLLVRLARGAGGSPEELRRAHHRELTTLAEQSGLGDRLRDIDAMKAVRHDIVQATRALGWQLTKFVSIGLATALVAIGLWFAGFHTINQLHSGFGFKALLFLALNFLLIAAATVAAGYAFFRGPPPTETAALWRAARRIVELLDVPIVSFGHTHDEDVLRLDRPSEGKAWYYNTGTWIAVFTHDVLIPRERVQFTFLRIRGYEAELLHWSPGRGEPVPVVLLDEDNPWTAPVRPSGIPEA